MGLRERERYLRAILQTTVDGFWVVDHDRKITEVNDAYCRMSGYTRNELLKLSIIDLDAGEDPVETGLRIQRVTKNGSEIFETRHRKKDGSVFDVEVSTTYLNVNGGKFVCFCRDIGERNQAEEALRVSESFLNTLLNSIPIPVFYKDREGRYLGFNKAYETFFGANREQLIGKTVFDINPPDLAKIYHAKDTELFESGGVQHYESQVKNALGPVRDVIFNKATFADSQGAISGLIGTILDVTDRKQAEAALAAETHQLAETNTTLRVLLQRREEDQKEMERKILDNIQKLVFPHLEKLRSLRLNNVQSNCLDIVTTNLHQITSPFLQNLAARFADFTPREVQVANMIREGKTSKEIASLFNSSIRSVEFHRDNIRKKLGLNQKKTNLSTFLRNLSE